MKVLFLGKQGGDGCTWYRMTQFKESAGRQGLADVQFLDPGLPEEDLVKIFKTADIFVSRLGEHTISVFNGVKEFQKPIVIDIDDRYDQINPFSDAYSSLGTKEVKLADGRQLWKDGEAEFSIVANRKKLMDFEEVMRRATAMMVTTFELKNYAEEFNKAVAVIPNAIKPSLFPQVKAEKGNEIRMLWAGGASHYADLAEISDTLTELMNGYPQLHFYFVGVPFGGITKNMPKDRVHVYPWIEPHGHGYRLATFNADIGLCPLQDTEFNRAKSSIKYYEYSAVRTATIARNIPPYADDIKHNHNGILYDTPQELFNYVSELINDPIKRVNLAENAYKYVTTERHIDEVTKDWVSFLQGIVDVYKIRKTSTTSRDS